ncbi:MAG: T9SS type A sorting domain-containing protein [Bacteroidia bacterium]
MKRNLYISLFALLIGLLPNEVLAVNIYVYAGVVGGARDGSSWENAFTDLQLGLIEARNSAGRDTIFLGPGTYKPTPSLDRTASFAIPGGTTILGGWQFQNGDFSPRFDSRNPKSIISGLLDPNTKAYHVVKIENEPDTVFLERILIKDGLADGIDSQDQKGAVVYATNAKIKMKECYVGFSKADGMDAQGGIIYAQDSYLNVFNSVFIDGEVNSTNVLAGGGALYVDANSEVVIDATAFTDCNANIGASIRLEGSLSIVNSTLGSSFSGDKGGILANYGGTLFAQNIRVLNSGGKEGGAIVNSDSAFAFINGMTATNVAAINGEGGVILNEDHSRLHLINASFSLNEAQGNGGAIANRGGAISYLTHCTIANNLAVNSTGGGVYTDTPNGVYLNHCIVASNFITLTNENQIGFSGTGSFRSLNWNTIAGLSPSWHYYFAGSKDQDKWVDLDSEMDDNLTAPLDYGNLHYVSDIAKTRRFKEDANGNIDQFALHALDAGSHPDSLTSRLNAFVNADLAFTGSAINTTLFPQGFINYKTILAKDQRGIERDAFPDLGAYEHREVKIVAPRLDQMCLFDTIDLGPIIIQDSTGGAMLPGSNQTIILELPPGFTILPNVGSVEVQSLDPQHSATLKINKTQISSTIVLVTYEKGITAVPAQIVIKDLKVVASVPNDQGFIRRIGGSAKQLGNELYENEIAELNTAPGWRPNSELEIESSLGCAGGDIEFEFDGGQQSYMKWSVTDLENGQVDSSFSDSSTQFFYAAQGGKYLIELEAGPNEFCTSSYVDEARVLDFIKPEEETGGFYLDDFETEGTWFVDADDQSGNSWEWDIPAGAEINIAASGARVWITNADSNYLAEERSYLNSPCFLLDGLENPLLSFEQYIDTEFGFDGVALEFRVPGIDWTTLGIGSEKKSQTTNNTLGYNWYNQEETSSSPGVSDISWSGHYNEWQKSQIRLDAILDSLPNSVFQFRFAFASDDAEQYEGVAIDDFKISSQTEKVLLEQFEGGDFLLTDDIDLDDMIVAVYPKVDLYYDMDVRALEYGIQSIAHKVIDGQYFVYENALNFVNPFVELNRRLAKPMSVRGEVNPTLTEIEIIAESDFDGPVKVYVITGELNDQGLFEVRNMIPNVSGIEIESFRKGNAINLSLDQRDANRPIPQNDALDPTQARALVVVQDQFSKEVYYAELFEVGELTRYSPARKGVFTQAVEMRIFPNPATDYFQVSLDHQPETPYHWSLTDMAGRAVASGSWKPGNFHQIIQTSTLSAGVYFLSIPLGNGQIIKEKISIIR